MTAIIDIHNLHLSIITKNQPTPVLRGVELRIEPGQICGLVGESGAGKTLIAKSILGIAPKTALIDAGYIRFNGRELTGLSLTQRRPLLGRHIALIPQDPMTSLNPVRRIGAQISDSLRFHLALNRRQARERVLELLAAVHIHRPEQVARQYPFELSGGMRQRVLIAIAFACQPELIIADEPTTALDVTVQRQILRLIKERQTVSDTALLFISHDLGVVAKICDFVSVIHSGRIVESASVADLFQRPAHPYTRALLAATPRYDQPGERLLPVAAELTRELLREAKAYDDHQRSA